MEAVCSRGGSFRTVLPRLGSVNEKKYAASTFRDEIGFLRSNATARTGCCLRTAVRKYRYYAFAAAKKYGYDGKKPL